MHAVCAWMRRSPREPQHTTLERSRGRSRLLPPRIVATFARSDELRPLIVVEQACLGLREARAVPLTEQATSVACLDTPDAALAIPLLEPLSR